MRRLCLSLLVFWGCGRTGSEPAQPESAATAPTLSAALGADGYIENFLPVDGCSYPVTIADVQYAPSPASEERVLRFLSGASRKSARIEYTLTGNTGSIACGWSGEVPLPEIAITSLTTPTCADSLRYETTCVECTASFKPCAHTVTVCTPTCSDRQPCAAGTCLDGVCWLAATCSL
jgi:hypothetical protein